jgi:ribosomal protein S14
MTTYYATPAAANYYTPPSHSHRQRGVRVCDTCGSIEQPTIKPFRLCGGCVRHPIAFLSCGLNTNLMSSDVMQMTTNYCVSTSPVRSRRTHNNKLCPDSPKTASASTGHRTNRSANTPWPRWPMSSSSQSAPTTRTKTSPSSSAASPPSTPPY